MCERRVVRPRQHFVGASLGEFQLGSGRSPALKIAYRPGNWASSQPSFSFQRATAQQRSA